MSDLRSRLLLFFTELKRRRMFRVVILYVIVAFAVLEGASNLASALNFPEWTLTLVAVLVLLGLPVSLILGWVFDITSAGVVRTQPLATTDVLPEIAECGYARPESLVTTGWVADHLNEPAVKVVEVDVDTAAYDDGHIPGAIGWNWKTQLMDVVQRDLATKEDFEKLLRESGISNDDTIVLYGDNNNWFAAYAYWQLEYYGHKSLRLMNGSRVKWLEEGREITRERPRVEKSDYKVRGPFEGVRAYRQEVERAVKLNLPLVDVRSPDEFTGCIIAPPGLPETAQRGGHIPGARNVPWSKAVNKDGTFKSRSELEEIYVAGQGVTGDTQVIAYCRIGERSSHTWFVLKYLLGFDDVKNYDGSWTEWGNLVGALIERGNGRPRQ